LSNQPEAQLADSCFPNGLECWHGDL
jgi:hypothetical protein